MPNKAKVAAGIGLVVAGFVTLAGCDDLLDALALRTLVVSGSASVGMPLSDASVTAVSLSGDALGAGETNEDGQFGPVPVATLREPFVVEAADGLINGQPFDGTLAAYVPYGDSIVQAGGPEWDPEQINPGILSTCVCRYLQATGVDYPTALQHTARFFEIPEDVDLLDPDLSGQVFSPFMFLEKAAAYGSFDDYVASLVQRIGGGETVSMAPSAANAFDVVKYDLGTLIGYQILSGLGAQAAKQAFPYLLAAVGMETFESSIDRSLTDIKSDLQAIKSGIDRLGAKVDTVVNDLHLVKSQLTNEIKQTAMADSVSLLNTQYDEMLKLSPDNRPKAKRFADAFPYQINQAVANITEILCGSPGGMSKGSLEAVADLLSEEIHAASDKDKGDVLYKAYLVLETYFRHILAIQMKGVAIETNLRTWWDLEDGTSGAARAYLDNDVSATLDKCVDHFLMAVEKLVIQTADVRTLIYGEYGMFPREAVEAVFNRADFLAHLISARHSSVKVLRIIGDRPVVEACLQGPRDADVRTAAIALPASGPQIREYEPPFPDYYTRKAYVAFKGLDFYVTGKVAVARLDFPDDTYDGVGPSAKGTEQYSFPFLPTAVVRYAPRDIGDGTAVVYGEGLLVARGVPKVGVPPFVLDREGVGKYVYCKASGKMVDTFERTKAYGSAGERGGTIMFGGGREELSLWNRSGSNQTIEIKCDTYHTAKAKGFDNAATHTCWDSYHYFNMTIGWNLKVNEMFYGGASYRKLIGYEITTGRGGKAGTMTYARSLEKQFSDSATWVFRPDIQTVLINWLHENSYQAWAEREVKRWEQLSDKGSTVTFTHQLQRMELIPR